MNECKSLPSTRCGSRSREPGAHRSFIVVSVVRVEGGTRYAHPRVRVEDDTRLLTRGLHWSTSQLNLSRF